MVALRASFHGSVAKVSRPALVVLVLFVVYFLKPINGVFSDFRCVGQAHNDREDGLKRAHKRHCVFHNVCHESGGGDNLLYFEDSSIMSSPKDSAFNAFNYDFYDGKWVQLGPFEGITPVWGPQIVRNEFGINETFKFDRNASRYVLHQGWSDGNPGHLMETMLALFGLPQLLGYEYSRDIRLLDASPSSNALADRKSVKLGEKHRKELLYSLSDHTPTFLSDLGTVCFETLFVGMGTMSPQQAESYASIIVPPMLQTMLLKLPEMWLSENKSSTTSINDPFVPERHKIVVLEKRKSSSKNDHWRIHSHGALIKVLNELFMKTGIAEVVNLCPYGVSWRTQIELVRSATIIVSPSGGISFLASFAREEAAIVLLDANYDTGSTRAVAYAGTDNQWFSNLKVRMVYYPVCSKDEDDGNINIIYPRMYLVLLQTMMAVEQSWPSSSSSTSAPFNESSSIQLYRKSMRSFLSASAENSNHTEKFKKFMSLRDGYLLQPCSVNRRSVIPILTREEVSEGVWTDIHIRATKIAVPDALRVEFRSQFGNKVLTLEEDDISVKK